MLGYILGALCIALGLKAFTPAGLPVTKTKSVSGTSGKVLGAACILLGILFILDAVLATGMIIRLLGGESTD
jgi:hypothetical protein